ncbi:unnamed protein product, partial [marine sediment metagenome]
MKRQEVIERKPSESLSYEVVVKDKDGKVVYRGSAPSRSFVAVWNQILFSLAEGGPLTIKDNGGTPRSVSANLASLRCEAGIGFTAWGLRVGKGSTPVDISDYALETPITEGVGAQQLSHQATQWVAPTVDGSDCYFQIGRVMVNNTGDTVTGIRELGAYIVMAAWNAMGFRDVLPSEVYVPHGGSITVTYTINA